MNTPERTQSLHEASMQFVRLSQEAAAHVKEYYPEGVTMDQFQMIYADAFAAEAQLAALRAAK